MIIAENNASDKDKLVVNLLKTGRITPEEAVTLSKGGLVVNANTIDVSTGGILAGGNVIYTER